MKIPPTKEGERRGRGILEASYSFNFVGLSLGLSIDGVSPNFDLFSFFPPFSFLFLQ